MAKSALVIAVVLTITFFRSLCNNINTDEDALLQLKDHITDDPHSYLATNWTRTTNTSVCNWIGVSCGRTHRRVTALNISSMELRGSIPPHIGNLSFLSVLILSYNSFHGPLPIELLHLHRLQFVEFRHNHFTGNIPAQVANLTKLRVLNLSYNNFTGSIPKSLFNCSMLWFLALNANNLTGSIPTEIGKLHNLKTLYFGFNMLIGPIPSTLFNITIIQIIGLYSCQLSGILPSNLGQGLPNLEGIYLWGNQLTGAIPTSISNASMLTQFDLGLNFFSGPIPNTLCNLRYLTTIILSDNHLIDYEPSKPELSFLTSLASCKELNILELSHNPLNVHLPASILNLSALYYFNIDGCNIKGEIPKELGLLSNLTSLHLENNKFVGSIPAKIFSGLQKLQELYIQGNNLHGSLSTDFCQLKFLGELVLSHNNLSGPLPDCLGSVASLRMLHLDSNRFSSPIPSNLWSLKDILVLNLSSNSLSGQVLPSIGNLRAVTKIDLSSNYFSGVIPNTIGGLQSLTLLSLQHNRFEGHIPQSFGNLISLEALDLSSNNLSGSIPKSLEQLKYFKYLNLSYNQLQGEIPTGGPFVNFTAQSFLGNSALCGSPSTQMKPCKISIAGKSKISAKKVLIYVLPAIILSATAIILVLLVVRRRKPIERVLTDPDAVVTTGVRRISYHELQQATFGFCESNLLGSGGFGSVYKGTLADGTNVAIKVFNSEQEGAFRSFDVECEVLSQIRHRNLVKVISSCSNLDFRALILEYIPNGSLEKWLYSHNYCLNISQRIDIMIDVASAVEYLSHGYNTPIVHCDLKPSNVLLDNDMVAHVADFGIAKLLGEEHSMTQTRTLATIGYMAPEYGSGGIVSTKGDVYSFGILLMETFTRKKPTDEFFGGRMSLRQYIKEALPDAVIQVADANLLAEGETTCTKDCLASILGLALDCSVDLPEERIDISQALVALKKIRNKITGKEGLISRAKDYYY